MLYRLWTKLSRRLHLLVRNDHQDNLNYQGHLVTPTHSHFCVHQASPWPRTSGLMMKTSSSMRVLCWCPLPSPCQSPPSANRLPPPASYRRPSWAPLSVSSPRSPPRVGSGLVRRPSYSATALPMDPSLQAGRAHPCLRCWPHYSRLTQPTRPTWTGGRSSAP